MRLSIHSLIVFAPDLEVAREFYGETLGLELADHAEGHLRFRGSDFMLTVFSCAAGNEPGAYSAEAGSSAVFAVASIDAALAELEAKGVRLLHAQPQDGPLGRYVAFADPFGTVHELIEPRDRA